MSALSIQPTYPIFTDIDGQPLEAGYVWIGIANTEPIGNPINVYWDAALTILAPQPIRTLAGYPSRNGTPARLYVNSDYSIQVQNKNGSVVYSAPTATERYSEAVVNTNAANVVYDPAGTGAVPTTVQTKLRETVSVKDFGAVGDGVADDTVAIQDAINAANVDGGKSVYFPAGDYIVSSTINSTSAGQLLIYGDGMFRSRVVFNQITGIMWSAGVWGLDAEDIAFIGNNNSASTGPWWYAGTTGLATTGVLFLNGVRIAGFETAMDINGGFYHRFDNCSFDRANTVYLGGTSNNVQFSQCRMFRINDGVVYTGGSGPIVFSQCAFETFYDSVCKGSAGARTAVSFIGCYFENYPNTPTVAPLPVGFFDDGRGVSACDNLVVTGCNISLKGIRRFLNNSGSTTNNLVSTGNRFNYSSGSQATCESVYFADTLVSGYFNDFLDNNLSETGGAYTTDYFSGSIANRDLVGGFDGITNTLITRMFNEATAADIASAASAINTTAKYTGKIVWDTTNNRLMRTAGATTTSVWWIVDGSASVTPS